MSEPVFLDVETCSSSTRSSCRGTAAYRGFEPQPPRVRGRDAASDRGRSVRAQGPLRDAAAYAFHIAQNQPFVDGNKRTGLLAALVFLDLNGIAVADPEGHLYDAMIAIAERRSDKPALAALLRTLAKPIEGT